MSYPYYNKPVLGLPIDFVHPLSRGLVGCWLFNEGSGGKVFDLSGYGNNGTLQADTHFVTGKFGSCLDFDGTGDYVDCGSGSHLDFGASTDFTLLVWVLTNVSTNGDIVGKVGTGAGYFTLYFVSDTQGWARIEDDSANDVYTNFAGITRGEWTQAAAVFDRDGNCRTYVNSVASSSEDISSVGDITNTNTSLTMGKDIVRADLNAQIDHVMIWNRALTAGEIAQLYREPFCMFRQEPIELWSAASAAVTGIPIFRRRRAG